MNKTIRIPEGYNYIAVFLTLKCNFRCSYCINRFGGTVFGKEHISGEQWLGALNRIAPPDDLPLTLQGGEPGLHPDFFHIISGIRRNLNIDMLTCLDFDIERFMISVEPERMKRHSPYASIRVSYHPETMRLKPLVKKVLRLGGAGYSVGIWGVMHPKYEAEVLRAKDYCESLGIDFRTKEFLGKLNGRLYGTFKYPRACDGGKNGPVMCRVRELIIGPDGGVYRCHNDLYTGAPPIGSILEDGFEVDGRMHPCNAYGQCNPCDVKVKTNRFQVFGYTAAEIRPIL